MIFLFLGTIEAFQLHQSRQWPMKVTTRRLSMAVDEVDVAVLGAGVGGCTIAWMLADREECKVALIDPKVETGTWYPNYGEWRKEWNYLSETFELPEMRECLTTEWEYTDCFFGGSNEIPMSKRTTLKQPYVRVDKKKLKSLFLGRFKSSGNGITVESKVTTSNLAPNLFKDDKIVHSAEGSVLTLDNGQKIKAKMIIDSTGTESSLTTRESPVFARGSEQASKTGYQIAYGFTAHVSNPGPYDPKAMTLFDYRTDHFPAGSSALQDAMERPTFMYVMPLREYQDGTLQVFFEETSLVGEGDRRLEFETCKQRAMRRLEYHGMEVLGIEEEEYCYIPMGGELPDRTQRIVAFGGAANMVHPSTGYQACRMMAAATEVAKSVSRGLKEAQPLDAVSAMTYSKLWSTVARNQRDFQVYGGDFLEQQPVSILRGFFDAFFKLDDDVWGGFLAGYPSLPGSHYHESWTGRLSFALQIFANMPNDVRLAMILYSIKYTAQYGPGTLLRSITPPFVLGTGPADIRSIEMYYQQPTVASTRRLGDIRAKDEARIMMKQFVPSGTATPSVADKDIMETEGVLSGTTPSAPPPSPFIK